MYALLFLAAALLCGWLAIDTDELPYRLLLLALIPCFGAISFAYWFREPRVLLKRRDGRLFWLSPLLFWPYQAFGLLTLKAMRVFQPKTRYHLIDHGLYLGALLDRRESRALEFLGVASVLDLCAELPESQPFRALHYRHIPLLDAQAPKAEQLAQGANWITQQLRKGSVYVHCALGHGRSATFVAAYLLASGKADSVETALARLAEQRPGVKLNRAQRQALEEFLALRSDNRN